MADYLVIYNDGGRWPIISRSPHANNRGSSNSRGFDRLVVHRALKTVHSTLIWVLGGCVGLWEYVRMIAYYCKCMCKFIEEGYSKGYSKLVAIHSKKAFIYLVIRYIRV